MANRNRGARQSKQWSSILGAQFILTTNGHSAIAGTSFDEAGTVLRMLGGYTIGATSAPTAVDSVGITVGIGIVSDNAFAVGTTALPAPATSPEFPWLYWASDSLFFSTTSVQGSGSAPANVRRNFDVRSMRKFKPGETLTLIVQYADIAGAPPVTVTTSQTRVLIGLH